MDRDRQTGKELDERETIKQMRERERETDRQTDRQTDIGFVASMPNYHQGTVVQVQSQPSKMKEGSGSDR